MVLCILWRLKDTNHVLTNVCTIQNIATNETDYHVTDVRYHVTGVHYDMGSMGKADGFVVVDMNRTFIDYKQYLELGVSTSVLAISPVLLSNRRLYSPLYRISVQSSFQISCQLYFKFLLFVLLMQPGSVLHNIVIVDLIVGLVLLSH